MEFEIKVAEELSAVGWNASVTKGSGDQGADVVARRKDETLVVQCKYYSRAVGNKAVQEVSAARKHYGADVAAVVTNSSFTPSAEELAASNGVILAHYVEISERFG